MSKIEYLFQHQNYFHYLNPRTSVNVTSYTNDVQPFNRGAVEIWTKYIVKNVCPTNCDVDSWRTLFRIGKNPTQFVEIPHATNC